MEFNKPVSNPMLVGAIEVMKADPTQEHKNMFLNEMMNSKFLAPAIITPDPEPDEEGNLTLTKESKIQFPMLTAPDGKNYFMAFTDKFELKQWKDDENTRTFALTINDYIGMILRQDSLAAGFVMNPYGANIVVQKEMLASLLTARMAQMKGAMPQAQPVAGNMPTGTAPAGQAPAASVEGVQQGMKVGDKGADDVSPSV